MEMPDNAAAMDAAVNVLAEHAEAEYGVHISRDFLQECFSAALKAYNETSTPEKSTQDAPPLESAEDDSAHSASRAENSEASQQ